MIRLQALTPLALACLTLTAQAQSQDPAQVLPTVKVQGQRDDYKAPETATGNRTATPSLQSAQSVQVVTRAVLEDQSALQLSDALRNVSGVQSDFGFNGSAMPLTILRGFPSVSMTAMGPMSGSSTYYIDGSKVTGVPINMATPCQPGSGTP